MKLEKCTLIIKGKEYNFIKPNAVDIINIEDECINEKGEFDSGLHSELMLGLVTKKLKVQDLVEFNSDTIIMSNGEEFTIPEITYNQWVDSIKDMKKFSRVKFAELAVKAGGVSGDIKLDGFTYEDIDSLAQAYYNLYDNSELKSVIEKISTFCL